MPLLGKLITACFAGLYSFIAAIFGAAWAVRITAAITLATIYLVCITYYIDMIQPWFAGLFSTAYGQLLGLLFPPISGTITVGISLYYSCVAAKRYTGKLMKMAVG